MVVILLWVLIGAAAWFALIYAEGKLEIGDIIFLPTFCILGPIVAFAGLVIAAAKMPRPTKVLWKRKK
jgi:hypothetical protein